MLSIAFLIIVVMDPFGNIPMVNSLVSQAKTEEPPENFTPRISLCLFDSNSLRTHWTDSPRLS